MTDKQFIDSLDDIQSFNGDKERQVEAVYNDLFKDRFNKLKISNPFKCEWNLFLGPSLSKDHLEGKWSLYGGSNVYDIYINRG